MTPQAPEVHHAWPSEGYDGINSCPSMRPTCILGEPWSLNLTVTSYPAPTFTWKKGNTEIGKTISGGTPLQRNPQLKEETNQQDDASASFILTGDGSAGTESTSTSAEVVPGRVDDFKQRPVINNAKKQSISNFWQKKRMRCSAQWTPNSRTNPKIGVAESKLYIDLTKPEDAGNYTVQVSNQHGTIDHSFRIDFTPILVKDISQREVQLEAAGGTLVLEAEVSEEQESDGTRMVRSSGFGNIQGSQECLMIPGHMCMMVK